MLTDARPFDPPPRCRWCRRPIAVTELGRVVHATSKQRNCGHGGGVATPTTGRTHP